ncbi:peroxidase 2-like [Musa acuminata AAA Group]|uniref:Peroxidase n=1 Tax=Musa acuminata subsp. malaccensis TaxID=214687 RepID=A0A804JJS8_MUSAM|nr:unnamed protein product [Musa acuminata subsp. malaccensis]
MAFFTRSFLALSLLSLLACAATGKLSASFYDDTCPSLQSIVRSAMSQAVSSKRRTGASILRLFFHDCFVNGCDASILLVGGERNAPPNKDSVRGFDVIAAIKSQVEAACRATVSCADILALAARDAVALLGGPSWQVLLGRRDARTANETATRDLPSPFVDLSNLTSSFDHKGFSAQDMTALSGAHTIGIARCPSFRDRIYHDANIDPDFAALLRQSCPPKGGDDNPAPLDLQTPDLFDNKYYENLLSGRGLLHSDQELFNGGSQDELVSYYVLNETLFFEHFAAAMVKMGNISPLTGSSGEVRLNCSEVN